MKSYMRYRHDKNINMVPNLRVIKHPFHAILKTARYKKWSDIEKKINYAYTRYHYFRGISVFLRKHLYLEFRILILYITKTCPCINYTDFSFVFFLKK